MTDLLLVTNRFPFGTGEEYLEAELPHLCRAFDRVVIAPTMQRRGQEPTRAVPASVIVLRPDLGAAPWSRLATPLSAVLRGTVDLRLPHLGSARPRRWVHRAYEGYFEARAQAVTRRLEDELVMHGIEVPPVVYSYWLYVTARVGLLLADRQAGGRPIVISRAHGYDVNVAASPVGYLPQRHLLVESLDRVHPVAEATSQRLRGEHPAAAGRITTRRLGSPGSGHTAAARQHPFHVVTVSTVRPLKRLDLVLDAVALLQAAGTPVTWTHLGGGQSRQVRALRERADTLLAPGTVHLPGQVEHDAVLGWYRRSAPSVFVNVSTSEGVPVSVMEAMSHGVPVLATDVGGTAELVGDQPHLRMLPADLTAADLATALQALHDLPGKAYSAVSDHNLAVWQATWDADAVFRDFAREIAGLAECQARG